MQEAYWDRAADGRVEFTAPLQEDAFCELVSRDSRILDVGCGYGRIFGKLIEKGFSRLVGIDVSAKMIERARELHPLIDFRVQANAELAFDNAEFDAVILLAVLTCIPADADQQKLI